MTFPQLYFVLICVLDMGVEITLGRIQTDWLDSYHSFAGVKKSRTDLRKSITTSWCAIVLSSLIQLLDTFVMIQNSDHIYCISNQFKCLGRLEFR